MRSDNGSKGESKLEGCALMIEVLTELIELYRELIRNGCETNKIEL